MKKLILGLTAACLCALASGAKLINRGYLQAKTCLIISKCSMVCTLGKTCGENMISAGCCHPLNSKWQQNEGARRLHI